MSPGSQPTRDGLRHDCKEGLFYYDGGLVWSVLLGSTDGDVSSLLGVTWGIDCIPPASRGVYGFSANRQHHVVLLACSCCSSFAKDQYWAKTDSLQLELLHFVWSCLWLSVQFLVNITKKGVGVFSLPTLTSAAFRSLGLIKYYFAWSNQTILTQIVLHDRISLHWLWLFCMMGLLWRRQRSKIAARNSFRWSIRSTAECLEWLSSQRSFGTISLHERCFHCYCFASYDLSRLSSEDDLTS